MVPMPHLAGIEVRRAWRHRNEAGRIHYIVTSHEGVDRHLYVAEDTLLDAALLAQGYTGPKSGQGDEDQGVPLGE
jgi:hypothetical protein